VDKPAEAELSDDSDEEVAKGRGVRKPPKRKESSLKEINIRL